MAGFLAVTTATANPDVAQDFARFRSRRSRRRQRPAVGRHPPRRAPPRSARSTSATRLHLVEASGRARAAQRATLGDVADRLVSSSESLPPIVRGRAHRQRAARRAAGPPGRHARRRPARGVRRCRRRRPARDRVKARVSTPALRDYLDAPRHHARAWLAGRNQPSRARLDPRGGAAPAPRIRDPDRLRARGARAVLADARGGHADDLCAPHDGGARRRPTRRRGSLNPGEQDITAHVDFTSVRAAAEAEGLTTLGFLDQTYFLLGSASRRTRQVVRTASDEP